MKRVIVIGIGIIVLLVAVYVAFRPARNEGVSQYKIRFLSLAWQEQALATNRAIVNEWNARHPDMMVEYVQGSWNSVYDYLTTGFETGDVPDVFHYESSVIVDFALRGFLTDLGPFVEPEMKDDILSVAWESVTRRDGQVSGIPFLMESLIGLYNKEMLEQAGIEPPTFQNPWTWSTLRDAARRLTLKAPAEGAEGRWGVAIGLRNSANIVMNLSVSFGGSYFTMEGSQYVVRVGPAERELLSTLYDLLYTDRSAAPSSIGQSGPSMIPGFIAGRYAMLVGIGAWARQQLIENARGLRWGVLPPLKAQSQRTGTSTQTLSIPKASGHQKEAIQFIRFMLNSRNMARLAQSDWMLPARKSCLAMPEFNSPENGWDVTTASARFLSTGPWMGAPGYVEWKSRIANPVLQEFFSQRLGLEEAAKRIEQESNVVLSRYQ